jgi:hypothetical protein
VLAISTVLRDKETRMKSKTIFTALVWSLLLGFSSLSADSVIPRGVDVFSTAGNGRTFYDFSLNPIPAGFFCKGSKAFTRRVAFKGLPLTTEPPRELRSADTVVERLDDVVFNDKGVGMTRIKFRALSLVSIAPIKTACSAYHVYVSLAGKQRVTTMTLFRTQAKGGEFLGPLAVDVRMTFIPVKPERKGTRKLEITERVTFPANPLPWSLVAGATAQKTRPVTVDTDGDLIPDAPLPGDSSFLTGPGCYCCMPEQCHAAEGHQHCTIPLCSGVPSCC